MVITDFLAYVNLYHSSNLAYFQPFFFLAQFSHFSFQDSNMLELILEHVLKLLILSHRSLWLYFFSFSYSSYWIIYIDLCLIYLTLPLPLSLSSEFLFDIIFSPMLWCYFSPMLLLCYYYYYYRVVLFLFCNVLFFSILWAYFFLYPTAYLE